jgi:hypothetical protein
MKNPSQNDKSSGGMRPDWKKRQVRNSIMGAIKMFVGVIVVAAVVGLGIVFRDKWMPLLFGKPEPKVVTAPPPPPPLEKTQPKIELPPPPPAVLPPPVVEKKAPPATVPPPIPTGEEELASKLIDQGRNALDNFDYEKAKSFFHDASQKKAGQLREDAATWEKKADAFAIATKHISVSDFAAADTAYTIETTDGQEIRGLKISEDAEKLRFQRIPMENPASGGKAIMYIDISDIRNRVALSKKQRHDEFLDLLSHLESSVSIQRSTDYYDLVFLSKRLGLGHECMEYLNRAWTGGPTHPADAFIADSFRKELIRRTIDRASLMLAAGRAKHIVDAELNDLLKTLKGYSVAEDEVEAFRHTIMANIHDGFKSTITLKTAKPAEKIADAHKTNAGSPPPPVQQSARQLTETNNEDIEVASDGVQGHGAAASVVDKANSKYEEGMKYYRGFKQGSNGDNNKNLRAALKCLDEAVDLYDQALKTEPNNKAIADRQLEANMVAYGCRKYQTL